MFFGSTDESIIPREARPPVSFPVYQTGGAQQEASFYAEIVMNHRRPRPSRGGLSGYILIWLLEGLAVVLSAKKLLALAPRSSRLDEHGVRALRV